jgi:hypothetical protein
MILALTAVALSLQPEAGFSFMNHPSDDQYVEYGYQNEVKMRGAVAGLDLRADVGRLVLTVGARALGHQYIEGDIGADDVYLACRHVAGSCPQPLMRWYTRMSTQQAFASVGFKIHAFGGDIVPTLGFGELRLTTTVQVTYPYAYAAGHAMQWYAGTHQDQPHPFVGVDYERGRWGVGLQYLITNYLPTNMGDPGQGESAFVLRATYRIGGGK